MWIQKWVILHRVGQPSIQLSAPTFPVKVRTDVEAHSTRKADAHYHLWVTPYVFTLVRTD